MSKVEEELPRAFAMFIRLATIAKERSQDQEKLGRVSVRKKTARNKRRCGRKLAGNVRTPAAVTHQTSVKGGDHS